MLSARGGDGRIVAAGIEGTVVAAADEGVLGEEVVARFLKEAGGEKARVVVGGWSEDVDVLADGARAMGVAAFSVVREVAEKDLEGASGVWMTGAMEVPAGVVVGGRATVVMGRVPGGVLGDAAAGKVAYGIGEGGALVVKGRRVSGVGEVKVRLAAGSGRERLEEKIEGTMDLTALRRRAVQRVVGGVFPPPELGEPKVERGTLVIVGGGGMPKGLMRRFVDLAGGPEEAKIVVIPISMPDPLPEVDRTAKGLRGMGVKSVTVLRGRTPEFADGEETLAVLREATGVWFGGGRQWRFVDGYEGTEALDLMHDVLKRGGVIGGSSAGASIQGEYMARGNPLGSREIMAPGYEWGFRFLPGVAIDQHFKERERFGDLASLVDRYPAVLGIGIDEGTALVVSGTEGEVVGKGKVHFYDRRKPAAENGRGNDSVGAGGRYGLVERAVLGGE